MKTIGDKIQDVALNKIGEKSLFTKGILSVKINDLKANTFVYFAVYEGILDFYL
jgi:porphobilinogen deaminase